MKRTPSVPGPYLLRSLTKATEGQTTAGTTDSGPTTAVHSRGQSLPSKDREARPADQVQTREQTRHPTMSTEQGRPLFTVEAIGKFDPSLNDAQCWLDRYIYFGKLSKTAPEIMAKLFGMFLAMGTAFNWFISLPEEVISDFEELSSKFLQRFSKKQDSIQITTDIFHMKQKPHQSVREYIYEVQTKAQSVNLPAATTLSAINGGLLSHIRADLRRNPPANLEELLISAEQSESAYAIHPPSANFSEATFTEIFKNALGGVNMLDLKQKVDNLVHRQTIHSVNSVNTPTNNNNNTNFRHSHSKPRTFNTSNFSKQNLKCRACGRSRDHDFSTCFAKSKTCYFCGKEGHIQKACFSFKKANNQ